MPDWQSVGTHRYYVDGNLFVMEMTGAVSLAEITELQSNTQQEAPKYPALFVFRK